jgi:PTS system nitrogen regulatory IIA component
MMDELPPAHVTIGLKVAGKAALLEALARLAAPAAGLAPAELARLLAAREALGSTGVGGGIALPHARVPGLVGVTGRFLRLAKPIGFDAVDAAPVDLVFLLLSGPDAQAAHLAALAAMARRLRDPQRCAAIRAARDADGVHAALMG